MVSIVGGLVLFKFIGFSVWLLDSRGWRVGYCAGIGFVYFYGNRIGLGRVEWRYVL